jgi:ribonuclease BN (tRNA processing enzyme)
MTAAKKKETLMFSLESLRAKHGDALLLHYGTDDDPKLIVIDAGPAGVFNDAVKPRLHELRKERELTDDKPLPIELMMVSHLDADHITGIIELMRDLKKRKEAKTPLPWKIARFWHNAFEDLIDDELAPASTAALAPASFGDVLPVDPKKGESEAAVVLASVGQGRDLRDLIKFFKLQGNSPFKTLVQFPHKSNPVKLGELELTIVGPDQENLENLRKDWAQKIKALLAKKDKAAKAEVAAYADKSVYNLSSIVVHVKSGNRTMLLTGDARGDYTLTALEGAGLLEKGGKMEVDILKLPHHGSDRNVKSDYFERIHAKHYVISADGKHTNPDVPTLKMISAARPDDDFTIWMANDPVDFAEKEVGVEVAKFFEEEKKNGRKYQVILRKQDELGVRVDL